MVRSGLKAALYTFGFRNITDTANLVKVHGMLENDSVDLLITGSELENNEIGFLIQETRHHRLGNNPFVQAIILLTSAEPTYVRRAIDSGADDLLLMPVAPEQLISRIEKMAQGRKPFVVTHDYIGPDRRSKPRPGEHSAPHLLVPNPLKARISGSIDGTRLNRQILEAAQHLNRMKVDRHTVQLEWLATHIGATIRDGAAESGTLSGYTNRLVSTTEDLLTRIKSTPAEQHSALVMELLSIARRLDSDHTEVGFGEVEKLLNMTKAVKRQIAPLMQRPG